MMTLEEIDIELEGLGVTLVGEYQPYRTGYGFGAYKADKPIHAVTMIIKNLGNVSADEVRQLKYHLLKWLKENHDWKSD